jgi:predicted nucleic acid-binding protein
MAIEVDALTDTNVLLRLQRESDPLRGVAESAVKTLLRGNVTLCVTSQNLIEYWNVATRPLSSNGLGRTPAEVSGEIDRLLQVFRFLPDDPAVFNEWLHLVREYGVSGVKVHGARLVAVMRVYGLTQILTFNPLDFNRYEGIVVVHPQTLTSPP